MRPNAVLSRSRMSSSGNDTALTTRMNLAGRSIGSELRRISQRVDIERGGAGEIVNAADMDHRFAVLYEIRIDVETEVLSQG